MSGKYPNIFLDPNVVNKLSLAHYEIPAEVINEFVSTILSMIIKKDEPIRILETGIGSGKIAIPIALKGEGFNVKVFGFDNSPPMLNLLKKRIKENKVNNLYYCLADAEGPYLPFVTDAFNLIFFVYFLHHIENWQHILDEGLRILKPGGALIFAEEISQWTYFIDGNFDCNELADVHPSFFSFWQYYYKLKGEMAPKLVQNNFSISATNYKPCLEYLCKKNASIVKIPQKPEFRWKRNISIDDVIWIIEDGLYPPLALGLDANQRANLAKLMREYIPKKEKNKFYEIEARLEGHIVYPSKNQ